MSAEENKNAVEKAEPKKVGVRLRIDQIKSIATVEQSYSIVAVLDLSWEATEIDKNNYKSAVEKNEIPKYEPDFIPKIDFRNKIDIDSEYTEWDNKSRYLIIEENGKTYNNMRIQFTGTFTEPFEVENYPFDVQDLTIVMDPTLLTINDIVFVPSLVDDDILTIDKTFLSISDWKVASTAIFIETLDWKYLLSDGKERDTTGAESYSTVYFRIQVRRYSFAIIVRVVLYMLLLGCLAFGAFGFKHDDITGRLSYTMTLILTLIAFQFAISSSLPAVPYLTLIDRYNLGIFVFVFIITIECIIVGWQEEGFSNAGNADSIFAIVCLVAFVMAHLLFIVFVLRKQAIEKSKIGKHKSEIANMNKHSQAGDDEDMHLRLMSYTKQEFFKASK